MSGIIVWMGIPVGVWVWVFQKQYTAVTGVNNNKLKMGCMGNNFIADKSSWVQTTHTVWL